MLNSLDSAFNPTPARLTFAQKFRARQNPTASDCKSKTDVFDPSHSRSRPSVYGSRRNAAAEGVVQKPAMDHSSRAGRDEIGGYYNNVLADLRKDHSEPEAMRLFDAFMQSEGYILAHTDEYKALRNTPPLMGNCPGPTGPSGPIYATIQFYSTGLPTESLSFRSDAAYQLRSQIHTSFIAGKVEYLADSYGIMNADRSWTVQQREAWQKQSEGLPGIDADGFLRNVPDGERRAIAGADDRVGEMLSRALKKAGMPLPDGESIVISFPRDWATKAYMEKGVETGNAKVDDIINGDPALVAALKRLRDSAPGRDLSQVPGQYSDGDRSVTYSQERQLVYSPGQTGAVVATDLLEITAPGYTYVKKVSDEFDTSCDQFTAWAGHGTGRLADEYGEESFNTLVEDMKKAIASGSTIKSTITREQYDARLAEAREETESYFRSLDLPYEWYDGKLVRAPGMNTDDAQPDERKMNERKAEAPAPSPETGKSARELLEELRALSRKLPR